MFNLLTEKLIRYRNSGGKLCHASLPEVYDALMTDEVEAFPALRPHQRHAWHAFLVQLGAMAMHRAGLDTPPTDAGEWQRVIRALTTDCPEDEPWQLVVDDVTKPAFMQPPAKDWTDYDKKELFHSPDALDMLDTAKNHDLKTLVAIDAAAEDWMFALIAMQTMNGQVGRGNYPIARMNSGDGSRTSFSVTPFLRPGGHIRRDIGVLLARSSEIMEELAFNWDGAALLWINQWEGEREKLPLRSLHPFFIEVCRRRRLSVDDHSGIYAMKAPSKGRLIDAAQNRGAVGDPWTLINLADKNGVKALTLQPDSFSYKEVTKYLTSGDWKRPILSRPMQGEENISLTMFGVRRKQGGQTEGYYERVVPVRSERFRSGMLRGSVGLSSDDLGIIAQERITQVGKLQGMLKDAVATFIAHGKDLQRDLKPNERQRVRADAATWSNGLDEIVDDQFFDDLQTELEETDESRRRQIRNLWLLNDVDKNGVINHARVLLHDATDSLPCPAIYRYKALTNAEGLFEGLIRGGGGFPDLFQKVDEEITEWQTNEQPPQTNSLTETQMTLFE